MHYAYYGVVYCVDVTVIYIFCIEGQFVPYFPGTKCSSIFIHKPVTRAAVLQMESDFASDTH